MTLILPDNSYTSDAKCTIHTPGNKDWFLDYVWSCCVWPAIIFSFQRWTAACRIMQFTTAIAIQHQVHQGKKQPAWAGGLFSTDGISSQKGLVSTSAELHSHKIFLSTDRRKKKKKGKLYQYEQYLFIILMANMLLAMQTRIDWIIPLASKNFTGWNTGINEANKNFSEKNVTRPGPECTITHDVRASASYN